MLVLGIDTSTRVGGLGLFDLEGGLIGESNLALEQTHSERLMPMLENLLQAVGLKIGDMDGFAVTVGPGSFTGTRIGVTTAKTLAQMTGKPIVGVSTLEVTALNLGYVTGLIYPVFDARNRRVYTAGFRGEVTGMTRISEDQGLSIDELLTDLEGTDEVIYLLGDGGVKYAELFIERLGQRVILPSASFWMPRGGMVAQVGAKRLARGEESELFGLGPNYLKPSQAEINWQKKHGK